LVERVSSEGIRGKEMCSFVYYLCLTYFAHDVNVSGAAERNDFFMQNWDKAQTR